MSPALSPKALAPIHIGNLEFSTGALAVACMSVIIGTQLAAFAFFTKVFAIGEGLLSEDPKFSRVSRTFTLQKGICFGLAILIVGLAGTARGRRCCRWGAVSVGLGVPATAQRPQLPLRQFVALILERLVAARSHEHRHGGAGQHERL